jgi:parallel beta-helix repeat protein
MYICIFLFLIFNVIGATYTVCGSGCNFTSIQAAINAANNSDTLNVLAGSYSENIDVAKSLQIMGTGADVTSIKALSAGDHVVDVRAANVTISGFNISGATGSNMAGVYLGSSNLSLITNNNISRNYYGISFGANVAGNTITNNQIFNNARFGLYFVSTAYFNFFQNNLVNGEGYYHYTNQNSVVLENLFLTARNISNIGKINLINCSGFTVRNSIILNNNYGNQYGSGIFLYNSDNNLIQNVDVSGAGYAGFQFLNSSYNTVRDSAANSVVSYGGFYIRLGSHNNQFINDTMKYSGWYGIEIDSSVGSNNIIENCNIVYNSGYGILSYGDNTIIRGNNVSINGNSSYSGIRVYGKNNTIQGNMVIGNLYQGISIGYAANFSLIEGNYIQNNGYYGLEVDAIGHIIKNNILLNNNNAGLAIYKNSSLIYNNIFNNTKNTETSSSIHQWNTSKSFGTSIIGGSYLGGNYWVYPNGTGFSQTCTDGDTDGICDTPFTIKSGNIDFLPLTISSINDADNDGITNDLDNCPSNYNPLQEDYDGDGKGDVCDNCAFVSNPLQEDDDNDNIGDVCDNCPSISNQNQSDSDFDGVGNVCDNCPVVSNADQIDTDVDGVGNVCDNCPSISNPLQEDADGDGIGNACDAYPNDYDNDGFNDAVDNCPEIANPTQADNDSDGVGDACDICPDTLLGTLVKPDGCLWCYDTDGGKIYNVKGNVTYYPFDESGHRTDYCYNSTALIEYSCLAYQPLGYPIENTLHACISCNAGACGGSGNAPVISNLYLSDITHNSATVHWTTDQFDSDNRVKYGLSPSLSDGIWSSWLYGTDTPTVLLYGLLPTSTYSFSAYSYNHLNQSYYSSSSISNFTTLRNPKNWTVDDNRIEKPDADFTSIQDAINASLDRDTILVYPGNYAGKIQVTKSLTISGINKPLIDGFNLGSSFTLKSSNNIIEGFKIIRSGWYNLGFPVNGSSAIDIGYGSGIMKYGSLNNIIRNNYFIDNGASVFMKENSNNNLIINNTMIDDDVIISTADSNIITKNIFINCTYGSMVEVYGKNSDYPAYIITPARNNRIENNLFNNSIYFAQNAVFLESYADNTILINNTFIHAGLRVHADRVQVINNTFKGNAVTEITENKGIYIYNANNTYLEGNFIDYMNFGVWINSQYYGASFTNTTMRNNALENNFYHLNIFPSDVYLHENQPNFIDFNHDIDTSNTVDGMPVYYLKNMQNIVFDYNTLPNAGYFACINCRNIKVQLLSMQGNSHGLLFYNLTNSVIQNVKLYDNAEYGIALFGSQNVTIKDSTFSDNSLGGVFAGKSQLILINNSIIETNNQYGITFNIVNNSIISNCEISDNGIVNDGLGNGVGIDIEGSSNNVIHTNKIICTTEDNAQRIGIIAGITGGNNLFYNNYLRNELNAINGYYSAYGFYNFWNTSKREGINIVNGPFIGGNYWSDYSGNDTNADFIGDTMLPYTSQARIEYGGDYLPLIFVPLEPTPKIEIISPLEMEYSSRAIILKHKLTGNFSSVSYSFDEQAFKEIPIDSDANLSRITLGEHHIMMKGRLFNNSNYSDEVFFRIIPNDIDRSIVYGSPTQYDEVSLSFIGRPVDHILSFEARYIDTNEIQVALNKHLNGTLGSKYNIVDYAKPGIILSTLNPSSGWTRFEYNISRDAINPGVENIISFINTYNAARNNTFSTWEIRNVTLKTTLPFDSASISVKASQKAVSAGEFTKIQLQMDVSNADSYEAYALVVDPQKKIQYYPNWNVTPTALDRYYLENNFYGELPIIYNFTNDSVVGKYVILGKIVDKTTNDTVSLSVDYLYYNTKNTIELFANKKVLSDNDQLLLDYALIKGNETVNGFVTVTLESPTGEKIYLPQASNSFTGIEYEPIQSDYKRVYEEIINSAWQNGSYSVIATLYDDDGNELSYDIETFDLCRKSSGVMGTYYVWKLQNLRYQMVSEAMKDCNLFFTDSKSMELAFYIHNTENHINYNAELSPGDYHISGYCTSIEGKVYVISPTPIKIECDAFVTQNVIFERSINDTFSLAGEESVSESMQLSSKSLFSFKSSEINLTQNQSDVQSSILFIGGAEPGYNLASLFGKSVAVSQITSEQSKSVTLEEQSTSSSTYPVGILSKSLNNEPKGLDANTCSKPKVILMSTLLKAQNVTTGQAQSLNDHLSISLRNVNQNIELTSYEDIKSMLNFVSDKILLGGYEGDEYQADLANIGSKANGEYLITMTISQVGSTFIISSTLIDIDLVTVIQRFEATTQSIEGLIAAVDSIVSSYGNIAQTLNTWEISHPSPPRDPQLSYTLTNSGKVSPEAGKNSLTITARVFDCRGNPVQNSKVNFKKYPSSESRVVTTMPDSDPDYVYSLTDASGYATATYYLIKLTPTAGKDIFKIYTIGRGSKENAKQVSVIKTGIDMQVNLPKTEVSQDEQMDFSVRLFSVDIAGLETPLVGKSISVDKSRIQKNELIPLGAVDGNGNPITEADGTVRLRFKAGMKDGLAQISFSNNPIGYDESVIKKAHILVKSEQYIISVKWSENYGEDMLYKDTNGWYTGWGVVTMSSTMDYGFILNTKTIWDKRSGREKSSGTLQFSYAGRGMQNDYSNNWRCDNYEIDKGCTASHVDEVTNTWIGVHDAHISSSLKDSKTANMILDRDINDNLYLNFKPIPIGMPLVGNYHKTVDFSSTKYGGDHKEKNFDFEGTIYSASPIYFAFHIMSLADYIGYWEWPDDNFVPKESPVPNKIPLYKTGKNSYKGYYYSYDKDDSGTAYDCSDYLWCDLLPPGSYLFNGDVLVWSTYYNQWMGLGDWIYYPRETLSRSFDVTVVKK